MRTSAIAAFVLFAATAPAQVADTDSLSPAAAKSFLRSIYRHDHFLPEFATEGTEALVCVFMSKDCPIAQLYMPRLKEMYYVLNGMDPDEPDYEPVREKVRFLAIYSNAGDDLERMAIHAQDLDYPFIALLDVEGQLAARMEVQRTPEVVVLDSQLKIRYRGAIDDQFFKGGAKPMPRNHYLADALHSILDGQPVKLSQTAVEGCRIEPHGRGRKLGRPTYHKDIAPILQKHCQTCHRPGEIGPFPLEAYENAVDHAEMILEVVEDRRMPPWPATSKHALMNDPRLSDAQIRTIRAWIANDLAEGTPEDAPPPLRWPAKTEWQIGEPNRTLEMDRPFPVPATGLVEYQYYRFKMNLAKDRWIRAVEVQAGNPRVVHHILVHQIPTGEGLGAFDMLQLYGGLGAARTDTMVGDYSPGDDNSARHYGDDRGLRLYAGNDIVFEVHYTPVGKAQDDRSRMGLILTDTPPQREIRSRLFLKPRGRFLVPPRHPHFRMTDTYWFEKDVRLLGVRPHLHLRGKNYRLDLVYPDQNERRETILQIPIWDYFWHKTYMFKEPIVVRAGTELLATVNYDNSEFNPNNPNPDDEVRWGQGTEHEMLNTFVLFEELEP